MNDPNRRIEIDKSSLLSLKAELLRKQEEVGRAKASNSVDDFVPKKAPKPDKDASEIHKKHRKKQHGKKPTPAVTELEDTAQLARSKQMLQTKAKYYERMVASGGALNSDENSLVMFNRKKQDTKTSQYLSEESEEYNSDSLSSSDSDTNQECEDGWVEYIDCLGRTRKCPKKDLEHFLARDRELDKSMAPRDGQRRTDMESSSNATPVPPEERVENDNLDEEEEEGELIGPMPPPMATSEPDVGERFREMREQWADQEEANLDKDSIHYQDVLFNEARLHGTGYYGFSTDQQERNRQRDELDSIRESTIEAQREREALRYARDKIIADRVKAARARQRARQGLPPEEEEEKEEEQKKASDQLYDTADERRRVKLEEKQNKKKEKEERRKERERATHVRPWDEGKEQSAENNEWVPAKERFVLSQHEWNDLKRGERIAEFAPPEHRQSEQRWSRPASAAYPQEPRVESESPASSDDEEITVGPMPPMAEGLRGAPSAQTRDNFLEDIPLPEEAAPERALFFTTKKNRPKKELKRRNLNVVEMVTPAKQPPVPIRNELSDDDDDEPPEVAARGRGAEIEPPPTYDYYGPSAGQRKQPANEAKPNLAASIEAGLKFLRNQSDKAGGPGSKNRWTSNADY